MMSSNEQRSNVLDEKMYMQLREYATFRHFYRHAYSFQLNWEKMKPLVENINSIWEETKNRLYIFIND